MQLQACEIFFQPFDRHGWHGALAGCNPRSKTIGGIIHLGQRTATQICVNKGRRKCIARTDRILNHDLKSRMLVGMFSITEKAAVCPASQAD